MGFSWSALIFNYFWFFYHDMFLHGFLWIVGYLSLYSLCALFTNFLSIIGRSYVYMILWFGLGLLSAFFGSKLLEEKLFIEGWSCERVIKARNIKETYYKEIIV